MDALIDEVESLEAILMDDVKITRNSSGIPELIETTVFPTVGEEVDSQYVCITLQVIPGPLYPDVKPNIKLKNPRGLDDNIINTIEAAVRQKLDESVGQPVVFDLIDIIREHLTESNLPSGQCVICLYGFQEGDAFTKTACYHYLHSHCLACHLNASRRNYDEELAKMPLWKQKETKPYQAQCPVCREPIDVEVEPLTKCRPPSELINAPKFRVTDELKTLQAQMSRLYLHQKRRGGIIDLEADEGNVIAIETEGGNSEASKSSNEISQESTITVDSSSAQPVSKQGHASAVNNGQTSAQHHHDRGNSSRHFGAGPGGSRGHQGHRANRAPPPHQNNASGGMSAAETNESAQSQQHNSHSHYRGGHRNRRGGHHHHNHHHHHHHGGGHHHRGGGSGAGANISNSTGSSQKNVNNSHGSGAR